MRQSTNHANMLRTLVFILVFSVPALLTRATLLHDRGVGFSWIDLRGGLLDLVFATGFALLAIRLLRVHRILSVLVGVIWVIFCIIGYEIAYNFDALAVLGYAGYMLDSTFFLGSAIHIQQQFAMLAGLAAVVTAIWLFGSPATQVPRPKLLVGGLAACTLALIVLPENADFAEWRQSNLIIANLPEFGLPAAPFAMEPSGEATLAVANDFSPDLAGQRVVSQAPKSNVLLIMLESVSGAYLPAIARQHGISYQVALPKLDKRAQHEMSYRTFVSQQRQTNRGEYAILCGDYPKLLSSTARMSEFAVKVTRRCLPQILKEEGYHTAYMQAAPLAFMMKDAFMAKIGFTDVVGYQSFEKAYSRSNWGVDDRAFLEGTLPKIRALDQAQQPWFATLLTAGTHHPINVPDSFRPPDLKTDQQRAFAWLDLGLEELLNTLEAEGILKNTLVVITSDESAGIHDGEIAQLRALSQNWGFAMLQTPEHATVHFDEPFAQSDLALSILDYLKLSDKAPHFVGRSMIRTYHSDRTIYFSNTYLRRSGLITSSGLLLGCTENLIYCQAWQHGGLPFSPHLSSIPVPKLPWQKLANAVERSAATHASAGSFENFSQPMVQSTTYTIPPKATIGLFGGQYLKISANTQMQVDLSFEVLPGSAFGTFKQDVISGADKLSIKFPLGELHGGDTATLEYTADFSTPHDKLEIRLSSTNLSDEPLVVRFNSAQLSFKSMAVEEDKLNIVQNNVTRAAAAPQR